MSYTMTFDVPQEIAAYVERRGPQYRAELSAIFAAIVNARMQSEAAEAEGHRPLRPKLRAFKRR